MKVDIKKVRECKDFLSALPAMFCDRCGETEPKHGFYPLWHYPSVSGLTCNKCYLTDEEYLKWFGEPK